MTTAIAPKAMTSGWRRREGDREDSEHDGDHAHVGHGIDIEDVGEPLTPSDGQAIEPLKQYVHEVDQRQTARAAATARQTLASPEISDRQSPDLDAREHERGAECPASRSRYGQVDERAEDRSRSPVPQPPRSAPQR